jgi:hypothetical protein
MLVLAAVWVIATASTFVWGVALALILAALCFMRGRGSHRPG